ncbi:MAG: glycosyltransferase [Alphaproteobacteria bacterium]|nr:glycosyltransferase [Alphaproteobacteria bacterium]
MLKNKPIVSVIIPVYNVEKYLRQCLDSVVNQTLKEIEIILIDDGSTDSSLDICREYEKKDTRIFVVHQTNKGLSEARNVGMEYVKGECIAFVDSDDYVDPCYLEKLYQALTQNEADFSMCNAIAFGNDMQANKKYDSWFQSRMHNESYPIDPLLMPPNVWNKLFRRNFLQKYRIKFPEGLFLEDNYWNFMIANYAKKYCVVWDTLYFHRKDNLSSIMVSLVSQSKHKWDIIKICCAIYDDLKKVSNTFLLKKCDEFFLREVEGRLNSGLFKITDVEFLKEVQKYLSKSHEATIQFRKKFSIDVERALNYPKVSVIIPIYNVGKYLRQCLDSVVNQTLKEIEIIMIDDGSTDSSLAICKEYAKKDWRIRIYTGENRGLSVARNIGMECAKGECIAFVDSDDYVDALYLEKLYQALIQNKADFSMCNARAFDNDEQVNKQFNSWFQTRMHNESYPIDPLLMPQNVWNKLFRREFIQKYQIKFPKGLLMEDNYWNFMVAHYAKRYCVIWDTLYFYRKDNPDSIMVKSRRKNTSMNLDIINVCCAIYDDLKKVNDRFLLQKCDEFFLQELKWRLRDGLFEITDLEFLKEVQKYLSKSSEIAVQFKEKFLIDVERVLNYPKVSVIIPVYNVEKYLRQCLDSVVNQTLKEIEIILIDDGSTDSSLSICKEYEKKDWRIQVYTQENKGAGAARNKGLKIAKGEYLSFLDSDDFFELNMLEKLYSKCIDTNSDICICRAKEIKGSVVRSMLWSLKTDYLWSDTFSINDPFFSEHLFQVTVGWAWDKLFKLSLVRGSNLWFSDTKNSNDLCFVYSALSVASKISYLNDELIFYRIHSKSLQRTLDNGAVSWINATYHLIQTLKKLENYERCKNSFLSWFYEESKYHYQSKKLQLSKRKLIIGIENFEKECPIDSNIIIQNLKQPRTQIKVSVVMPVYNVAKYLDAAMQSVINQTLQDIEIICVNDGSTDGSLEILKKYQRQDSRIKIIDKKNTGYGHSMNVGIQAASGEYVAILEPDDTILPNMYEVLYQKAKEFNLDFVKSDFYQVNGTRKEQSICYMSIVDPLGYNRVIDPQKESLTWTYHNTWNTIYKRLFLSQNRILHNETPRASYQDLGFFLKTLYYAKRIMILKQAFYLYNRINPDSSSNRSYKLDRMINEFRLNCHFFDTHPYNKHIVELNIAKGVLSFLWAIDTADQKNLKKTVQGVYHELVKLYNRGELIRSHYSREQWTKIMNLIYQPEMFYRRKNWVDKICNWFEIILLYHSLKRKN